MKLQPFDIIAIKNRNSIVSKMVRWHEKSIYSHVAIVLDDWHLVDTNLFQPTKIRNIDYKLGEFDCFRLKDFSLFNSSNAIEFIQKTLNQKYDLLEALNINNTQDKYICISLVKEIYLNGSVDLKQVNQSRFSFLEDEKLFKVNS